MKFGRILKRVFFVLAHISVTEVIRWGIQLLLKSVEEMK